MIFGILIRFYERKKLTVIITLGVVKIGRGQMLSANQNIVFHSRPQVKNELMNCRNLLHGGLVYINERKKLMVVIRLCVV